MSNIFGTNEKKIDMDKLYKESDYVQKAIYGFQNLQNKDYSNAMQCYSECANLAKQYEDDYKFADSIANYGITQFFCGKIKESIESLESAFRISLKIITKEDSNYSLHLKILCNLCLSFLSINRTRESLSYLQSLIDFIKSVSNSKQMELFKEVLFIFFRVESLVNYVDNHHRYDYNLKEKILVTNDNKDQEEIHQSIINRILYYLHLYLRENDIDSWIQCLSEESENFKQIKDYNGFIFAIFNQYTSLYIKNPELNGNQVKSKISNLCKILMGDREKTNLLDKSPDLILVEVKEKMETSAEIYKTLYEFEKHLLTLPLNSLNSDKNTNTNITTINTLTNANSSKVIIKIFLKHALNCLNEMEENSNIEMHLKQIRLQINLMFDLIDKDQIDCNLLQISKIDSEIADSLYLLFHNLISIKYRSVLNKYFRTFMYETLGYRTKKDLRFIKDQNFMNFEQRHFNIITDGSILTKINFSTSGKKEHFYRLDTKENSIRIYQKRADKSSKKNLEFEKILKFSYGISSENLRKRFKSMKSSQLNSPWLFFSIITQKRSLDLYMEEPQLINWFYGVRKYLREIGSSYKIISTNNFILRKLKLKIINKLKEFKDHILFKDIINNILQGKILKYKTYIEQGIQCFSFAKILLLYLKLKNK